MLFCVEVPKYIQSLLYPLIITKTLMFCIDLRQLKPVCAFAVFSNVKSEFGDLIGNPLWEEFQSFELDEIMRQKNDKAFADALNRLSRGIMTVEDIQMFKSREIRNTGPPPSRCIHLFKDNKRVGEYNTSALNAIQEETAVFSALDICQGKGKHNTQYIIPSP